MNLSILTNLHHRLSLKLILHYLLILVIFYISCHHSPVTDHSVKFIVHLKSLAIGQKVYLSGNNDQLGNWNPAAVPLNRESDSLWSATLSFKHYEKLRYKVTAGSWWTEALNKDETTYSDFHLKVKNDTTVYVDVYNWRNQLINGQPFFDAKRFCPKKPEVIIDDLWRYHSGDDSAWATAEYDDSSWITTNSTLRELVSSDQKWNGIGWFRFHAYFDSTLWGRTLAISISQLGASEIFYNGRLLYSFGHIGLSAATTKPNAMSWWQEIKIDPKYNQLIAVRYANYDWKKISKIGYNTGFIIRLKSINAAFQTAIQIRESAVFQMIFTIIPLMLFLLHLSLYSFFKKHRQNLYYAICMLGFAGLIYFNYQKNLIVNVDKIILFTKLNIVSISVAIFFGLLALYETNYMKLPKRSWAFFGIFCFISLAAILGYNTSFLFIIIYLFYGSIALEGIFTPFVKHSKPIYGGWFLFAGLLLLSLCIFLQILINYSVISNVFGSDQVYLYGMLLMAIAMSIFLSYNFARVNKDLEMQLINVRQLSEKVIEQERMAHKLDLERKVIEVENERKNKELESARELQLSLLPKAVPKIKGLDISAIMKTATEVGGDYYDFFVSENNTLTAVLGDATGHGLKAGNLVTATKGLLNILSNSENTKDILIAANRAIKQMDLHMLTMCLAIVRIHENFLNFSSAGMPPLLIYRAQNNQCEQIVLKAMPLGAVAYFPYENSSSPLFPGDVVAMVSDGLLEMFDKQQEQYGFDNVMESLIRHAPKSAEEIVQGLLTDGKAWAGDTPLVDDLTIIVIKVSN
jgi:serine phosphatase RsbU (regulator of sigma subunit)